MALLNSIREFWFISAKIVKAFGEYDPALLASPAKMLAHRSCTSSIEGSSLMEYNLFWYNNELWGILEPSSYFPSTLADYKEITITGYALTSVGRELFHITKRSSPLGYFEKITEFLKIYYDANIVKLSKR